MPWQLPASLQAGQHLPVVLQHPQGHNRSVTIHWLHTPWLLLSLLSLFPVSRGCLLVGCRLAASPSRPAGRGAVTAAAAKLPLKSEVPAAPGACAAVLPPASLAAVVPAQV